MILHTKQLVTLVNSVWSTPCRHYGRKVINPSAVTGTNRSKSGRRYLTPEEKRDKPFDKMDDDFKNALQNFEQMEPDISKLGEMLPEYHREKYKNKIFSGQLRMAKKHFAQYEEPEIDVLTYAEKEHIRYLNRTEPEEWTPENIAMSFPISAHGVRKLLKSPFRCTRKAEVQNHDSRIAETLEKIQSGEIKLNAELQEKMKIRNSLPINFGAISTPELGFLVVDATPKKLGTFGRLVSPNAPNEDCEENEGVNHKQEIRRKSTMNYSKNNQTENDTPPVNHGCQKINPSYEESEMLRKMKGGKMTLSQFEKEIQKFNKDYEKNGFQFPEVEQKKLDYLLRVRMEVPPLPSTISSLIETDHNFGKEEHGIALVQKCKKSTVEFKMEEKEAYIYKPVTGYQKPFATSPDHAPLPRHPLKSGSVYKVGDSYYDENGDFFYRPV